MFLAVVGPSTGGIDTPVEPRGWLPSDRERFATAAYLWAALAAAAAVSVAFLISYSLVTVWREAGWRWFTALGIIILMSGFLCYWSDAGASTSHLGFHEKGLFGLAIERLTKPFNAMVGAAVAALFTAGAGLSIRVTIEATPGAGVQAGEKMRTLILIGAVSTVLGVLSIGALHRLPGAAVTGSGIDQPARDAAWARVESLLDADKQPDVAHPAKALVARWITASTGMSEAEASVVAADTTARAKIDPGFKAWVMHPIDEAKRVAHAKALDGVATAVASWWGVVFATTLVVVYGLGILIIAPAAQMHGSRALTLTKDDEKGGWLVVIVRVLTALAPLLTAGLAEAIRKVVELLQPGA